LMALASPIVFCAFWGSSQKLPSAMRVSQAASCDFSVGRSKKPPELREAQFEGGDVGEIFQGHGASIA
jgi:hypothetical protein